MMGENFGSRFLRLVGAITAGELPPGSTVDDLKSKDVVVVRRMSTGFPTTIPGTKTARYYVGEDGDELLDKYGFKTCEQLENHVKSNRVNAAIPNVRFSYGVKPFPGDSNPTDPRLGRITREKEVLLPIWRMGDAHARHKLVRRARMVADGGTSSYVSNNMPPLIRTDDGERRRKQYEYWEEHVHEEEMLRSDDLMFATTALTYLNMKFNTKYLVEEVLGSKRQFIRLRMWYHCNFVASFDDDGSLKRHLFFTELCDGVSVTLCCILDDDGVRGCEICGHEFVHPTQGGMQAMRA